jgi:hypothetical protein
MVDREPENEWHDLARDETHQFQCAANLLEARPDPVIRFTAV